MLKRSEIQEAIKDETWQKLRISLKGLPTIRKLVLLDEYLNKGRTHNKEVQVENYIGALLRGGQLKKINNQLIINK